MDTGLADRSVVVTGAGSNIGRATALAFAREGARLTLADLDEPQTRRVAEQCASSGCPDALYVRTDVTDYGEVESLFAAAVDRHGRVDALVNSVGLSIPRYFTDTTPDIWQKLIAVNYLSVLNCTSVALRYMVPRHHGSIVSISSDASRQGEPQDAVYAGAKSAVNGFMKTVAKENGRHGIRCNVVCPGATIPEDGHEFGEGSMWSTADFDVPDERLARIARSLPLRKLGRAADIAGAVVFLSSDELAGHITGQVLSVSGGYTMVG